jgi:peptidoglycan hydrolase-like protein with peptidoglycan-binding domain/3D (Asp-Asp-Asp) domain-containing protein
MKTDSFCANLFWKTTYIGVCTAFASYIGLFSVVSPVSAQESDVSTELPPGFVDDSLLETTPGFDKTEEVITANGNKKTFVISAYYSPLPGQAKYVTGSYKGDIRLNGGGVHGADGSNVYPGMIAAPKSYAFGTKMLIPGIGTVAVHDRGGAIVNSGERGNSYDRLDVWMGYGDAGLKRAMKWGKRTVEVTLYGVNDAIKEEVYLEGYSDSEKSMVANTLTSNVDNTASVSTTPSEDNELIFGEVLRFGSTGENVKKIQEKLKEYGYYSGNISGTFDAETLKAVKRFQVEQKIVAHENAFGAGYVGPKTLKVLASNSVVSTAHAAEESIVVSNRFVSDLKPGDSGNDVVTLQEELRRIHLFGIEPTGVYGELTEHAVLKFQQVNMLAGDKQSPGAGVFGPVTRQTLNSLVAEREKTERLIADRKRED